MTKCSSLQLLYRSGHFASEAVRTETCPDDTEKFARDRRKAEAIFFFRVIFILPSYTIKDTTLIQSNATNPTTMTTAEEVGRRRWHAVLRKGTARRERIELKRYCYWMAPICERLAIFANTAFDRQYRSLG
jgi:hypothetical protein